jgi:hypothetical protein
MPEDGYRGYRVLWSEPPISLAMWVLQIDSSDAHLLDKFTKYRDTHGSFATPVGPLGNALNSAYEYIDAILAWRPV